MVQVEVARNKVWVNPICDFSPHFDAQLGTRTHGRSVVVGTFRTDYRNFLCVELVHKGIRRSGWVSESVQNSPLLSSEFIDVPVVRGP